MMALINIMVLDSRERSCDETTGFLKGVTLKGLVGKRHCNLEEEVSRFIYSKASKQTTKKSKYAYCT